MPSAQARISTLFVLSPLLGLGCTDFGFCVVNPETGECGKAGVTEDNIVRVEGTACTIDPTLVPYPYKVLFVIDLSTSNLWSDPNDRRAFAVQETIAALVDEPGVSFGVIGFSTLPEAYTDGFIDEYSLLVPTVINRLQEEIEDTNYVDTLALARQFIEEDALETPEAERHRTRYDIQWLSDGIPDPCQRPDAVFEQTEALMALQDEYGFYDLTLNTTRLAYDGYGGYVVAGCEDVGPADYLEEMAVLGHGSYRELTQDQLAFEIGFNEITTPFAIFKQVPLFLVNENRRVVDGELRPDSDGDGIADEDEVDATAGLAWDQNGDGCSDAVDVAMQPNPPTVCGELCGANLAADKMEDLDSDGLPDCAEQTLGFDKVNADGDQDGIPDLIELRFGTSPISDDLLGDPDGDSLANGDEIMLGTHPHSAEPDQSLRYVYGPRSGKTDGTGVTCYDFSISNVRLVHTERAPVVQANPNLPETVASAALPATRAGDNNLCVYLVQNAANDPEGFSSVTRACKTARYLPDEHLKEPANGVITFKPEDFVCYLNCAPGVDP